MSREQAEQRCEHIKSVAERYAAMMGGKFVVDPVRRENFVIYTMNNNANANG